MKALLTVTLRANDARDRLHRPLAQAQNISIEEAVRRVTGYEQHYRESVDREKRKALRSRHVAKASRASFARKPALLLGRWPPTSWSSWSCPSDDHCSVFGARVRRRNTANPYCPASRIAAGWQKAPSK